MDKIKNKFVIFIVIVILKTSHQEGEVEDVPTELDESERRFMRYSSVWNIANLKDTDFDVNARRADCKPESLQSKLKRYRKSLKEDASRIEFVSAFALPVDEKDLIVDKCNIPPENNNKFYSHEITNKPINGFNETNKKSTVTKVTKPKNKAKSKKHKHAINKTVGNRTMYANESIFKDVSNDLIHPATIAVVPAKNKKEDIVRRGDYMFSSVEYYDGTVDWTPDKCPDDVDTIAMETDVLRKYDVICELTCIWTSLI